MIPFDCYYTVCPKRFCLDVIASLLVNIKLQSQLINFINESLQSLLWQGFKRIPFKGNTTFAT